MARANSGLIKVEKICLSHDIKINGIYTFFYMEHPKDFVFKGERHDFWEFLYVDKGEVEVMAEDQGYKLQQGDIVFHKPREFHSVWANKKSAPNLIVITFDCHSKAMSYLEGKIFSLTDKQSDQLAVLHKLGKEIFSGFDLAVKIPTMLLQENIPFGSGQLFIGYLEAFLIELIRAGNPQSAESKVHVIMKERVENDIVQGIRQFLRQNIKENLSFTDICRENMISETQLKVVFKEVMGISVMKYFKMQKIEEAKRIIREDSHNITQIADMLGYSSIFHFSKCFKDVTGMTPTEYGTSVHARI